LRDRFSSSMITVAIAAGRCSAPSSRCRSHGRRVRPRRPARVGGKPNFSGIWQANNEANWDLQWARGPAPRRPYGSRASILMSTRGLPAAPVLALGAAGAVPGSLGVVQGDGQIPYKPEALLIKKENAEPLD